MKVFVLLASAALHAASAKLDLNGWYPCRLSSEEGSKVITKPIFECAEVRVPLCHQGVCESDEEINIFVKRLKATTHSDKAVWFFQGGPGGSSMAMESIMLQYDSHFNQSVDLYTLDHRGTGRSHFLLCDAAQAFNAGSPDGSTVSTSELPNCIKDLNYQIDNNREAFSVTSAAWDVVKIVEDLNAEQAVYLYGMSYGTFMLERVMQLEPPQVRGYIQDGVDVATTKEDGMETANSHWNIQMRHPSRRLLQYCYDDPECPLLLNSRDTVTEDLLAIYKKFDDEKDTNPCAQLLCDTTNMKRPSDVLRALQQAAQSLTERESIPLTIASVASCTKDDHHYLQQMLNQAMDGAAGTMRGLPKAPLDPVSGNSPMLYNVIVYSERWTHPSLSLDELNKIYENSVLALNMTTFLEHYCISVAGEDPACKAFGHSLPESERFTYDRDEYFGAGVTLPSNTSLMIVNGGLDFATPLEVGELAFKKYKGGKGRMMLNFNYGAHCQGEGTAANETTTCRDTIISSFVKKDGNVEEIDTSCMNDLPPLHFKTLQEALEPKMHEEQQHVPQPGEAQKLL